MSLEFAPFIGIIEDIYDSEQLGRVRVRVFGEHTDNKGKLPTKMLKWMSVIVCNSAGVSGVGDSPTGFVEGAMVFGYFVDPDHQEGVVVGSITGKPVSLPNPSQGFNDPTGTFPIYVNESDVNRLARGVETALVTQKKNTVTGIPGAFPSDSFNEPTTPFAAKYPYNRVFETASGHVVEYDDTPGAERIAIHHKSGTFEEIHPNGDKVVKTHGDMTEIFLGDQLVYISGDSNIIVSGDANLNVVGTYRVKAHKTIFDCDVDIYGVSSANDHLSSMVSGKDHTHSGVEPGPGDSGPPNGKQEGLFTPSPAASFLFEDDDTEWTESRVQDGVDKGYYTYQEYNEQAVEPTDDSRKDTAETTEEKKDQEVTECGIVITDGKVDYSTQLSTSYILADVTTNAAVSQYKIQSQLGFSEQEIACNLKHLALNVLDPIKAQYPNMIVTSGFRRGSGTSQHLKGQAVDMQFSGASKSDYYEIAQWIKNNVPFGQLLLEFKSTGTKMPWIHVSLSKDYNKYQVMTFWNHTKYSDGLVDLSGG